MPKLRSKKTLGLYVIAALLFLSALSPLILATEIIVNKSVSLSELTDAEVRAIFTMQKRFWSNNRQIKVYKLSDNSPLHKDFVKNILNMFPHQIRRIWDRLTYSGTGTPPIELDSEDDMIEKIASTPDSIGYLDSQPDNENIRAYDEH